MNVKKRKVLSAEDFKFGSSLENCISDLFNPDNEFVGVDFLESTILKLNMYLEADYVFVARLNSETKLLETDVICDYKEILPQVSLNPENVLFKDSLFKGHVTSFNDIDSKNLEEGIFRDACIQSSITIALKGVSNNVLGILSAFFSIPVAKEEVIKTVMYMFASRFSSELQHMENEREVKRSNLELLVFKEEFIQKNKELDKMNKELRVAKLKAEESDKLKSSFLANLSHEIRTPMNAIIGFTELLKSNHLTPEEQSEYLEIVHQNGNQLLRVMDALIDISKLQARAYIDERETVSINEMLIDLQDYFKKMIEVNQKPIELKLYIDAEDGEDNIYTQKEAIFKVFDHLIDNAVKFTHQGEILIGYQVYNDYYEFFVKDTGVGIPKGEENRIFDLFRQIDTDNTRGFDGNGIGLSIVKRYIEVMKGTVWAEPDQKEGALFKFRVPKYFDM